MTTDTVATASAGATLARARAAVVMLHGRGASAESILGLAGAFDMPDIAYVAPQAPTGSWYPHSFLAPLAENEPHLSLALETVGRSVDDLVARGVPAECIVLLGFSQGGCLALEYAARNARRYGGVVGLSAGLIGPEGTPRDYAGALDGTPVFVGCSDVDSHIPLARVHETAGVMRTLGGDVTERIYPRMGHTIVADELEHVHRMLAGIGKPAGT